ncbi:hypothetical protein ACS0TY_018903 [Phlomoides rotata]
MERNAIGGHVEEEKGNGIRGRRVWSKIEEDALVQCLSDIVSDGWKADNRFKVGFQRELEKDMRKLQSGTDIVVNPHINSKLHVWKNDYGALSDLLSKSGIGWNSITSTFDIIDEYADPHVKTMRHKPWPYYENWLDIFGKDGATGKNAADPMDLVDSFLRDALEKEGENVTRTGPTAWGTDDNPNVARTSLNDIMKQILGLSLQDKLKVSDELVRNKARLELFLSLPQDEQAEYVWMLLDGKLGPMT